MTTKTRIKFGEREVYFYRRKDSGQLVFGYKVAGKWKETRCPPHVRSQRDGEAYARAYLEELERTGERPIVMPPDPVEVAKGPTVAELAERWLDLRDEDPDLAPATKSADKSNTWTHIAPRIGPRRTGESPEDVAKRDPKLGDLKVEDLTSGRLREWLRALKKDRAPSTVRNVANTLTTLLEDAMAEEWIKLEANPMKHPGVRRELPEVKVRSPFEGSGLTKKQAEALIRCPAVPEHRRARYVLAFTSGLRDGEIAGLTWADVDLDAKPPTARVDKALSIKGEGGFAQMGSTKTESSRRIVPLHPLAVKTLRAWRKGGWAPFAGHEPKDHEPVFPNEKGEPWRPRSAELIRGDLEAANLPTEVGGESVNFHSTRASFMTWLTNTGVSETVIDMLVGHAGKSVRARHYTAADLDVMAKAVASIELDVRMGEVVALPFAVAVGQDATGGDSAEAPVVPPGPTAAVRSPAVVPAGLPAGRGKRRGKQQANQPDSQGKAPVAQWIAQRFPKPLVGCSTHPGGAEKTLDSRSSGGSDLTLISPLPAELGGLPAELGGRCPVSAELGSAGGMAELGGRHRPEQGQEQSEQEQSEQEGHERASRLTSASRHPDASE